MKKLIPVQVTVNLVENDYQREVDFSEKIKGSVVGYSTIQMGDFPALQRANIILWDGANQALRPIDIAVSEVITKNSVMNAITPLCISSPGELKATIVPSAQIGAGEEYSVKVILWYAVDTNEEIVSLRDCNL